MAVKLGSPQPTIRSVCNRKESSQDWKGFAMLSVANGPIKSGRAYAAVLISWRPFRLARSPRTNLSHFAMPARFSGI